MRKIIQHNDLNKVEIKLNRKGFANVYSLGRYNYTGGHKRTEQKDQAGMLEIRYCDQGKQLYKVGKKKYVIRGGDLFITYPGESWTTSHQAEEKGTMYWLQLEIPENKQNFIGYTGELAHMLIQSLQELRSRHIKGKTFMKKTFEEIMRLSQTSLSDFNRLIIYNLLQNFLVEVIKCAENVQSGPDQRIGKITHYIDKNIYKPLSIEMLARVHHISVSHFKSSFRKATGLTPMDYVHRRKIETAKQLLKKNMAMSITDITYMLNYSSSQYFATVFRKYVNLTPVEYRTHKKGNGKKN